MRRLSRSTRYSVRSSPSNMSCVNSSGHLKRNLSMSFVVTLSMTIVVKFVYEVKTVSGP